MVDKTTDNKLCLIGLYRSDYLAQYHARQMARLMQKSHVTLLPHLKSLMKEKILMSKTSGKNKVYSLNFENINAKLAILIAEAVETMKYLSETFIIKRIASDVFKLRLDGTIVLFGSYAKQNFKEGSDIDMLYIGDLMEREVQKIRDIGKVYGKAISIKKLSMTAFENGLRAKDNLIEEVIKAHIILHNHGPFIDALWRHYDEFRR